MPCCLTFSNQYGVIINTNDDNEDASQSVDLTYQPSNDSDDNDHLIKMGNYMDNDDSDIPDQDSNDSGKSSSDISKESNSEDGELTNQSEIIPVNRAMEDKDASDTSSGENSQVDILANKDHHHSIPEGSSLVDGQSAGVPPSSGSSSLNGDSRWALILPSPNVKHVVLALLDTLTRNSSESAHPQSALA